jgi:hypothetical protein
MVRDVSSWATTIRFCNETAFATGETVSNSRSAGGPDARPAADLVERLLEGGADLGLAGAIHLHRAEHLGLVAEELAGPRVVDLPHRPVDEVARAHLHRAPVLEVQVHDVRRREHLRLGVAGHEGARGLDLVRGWRSRP